jgi:hypothetical protein
MVLNLCTMCQRLPLIVRYARKSQESRLKVKPMAEVTADITLMPSVKAPILMDPRRALRKRMVGETALVKGTAMAIERAIQKVGQKAVQTAIARTAPMEEVPTVTAMPSPAVRVAEIQIVIPDLSREIREASFSFPNNRNSITAVSAIGCELIINSILRVLNV